MTLSLILIRTGRTAAEAVPHIVKSAICCGLPVAASHAGVRLWQLSPAGEYGLAVGVAAAVTAAEAVWPGRKPQKPQAIAWHFARNAGIAVGLTFAIHAAGLHPHAPEGSPHHQHDAHEHHNHH